MERGNSLVTFVTRDLSYRKLRLSVKFIFNMKYVCFFLLEANYAFMQKSTIEISRSSVTFVERLSSMDNPCGNTKTFDMARKTRVPIVEYTFH